MISFGACFQAAQLTTLTRRRDSRPWTRTASLVHASSASTQEKQSWNSSLVDGIWKSIESLTLSPFNTANTATSSPGAAFLQAVSSGDIDQAMNYVNENVEYLDTAFPSPQNRQQLERNLRLQAQL
jgi:hypothetical protein